MAVVSHRLRLSTRGDGDVVDLTAQVDALVRDRGLRDGAASVFVPGSTAAITLMEFEPGGVRDLSAALERLVPRDGDYAHNRLNNDTNSHAHIRAAVMGASETVPIADGRLATGQWQQLVLVDFDDRPRERTVVVQLFS